MPSTNKRINLTVPPEIYERIKKYMVENGELSDAGACLHLIVKQLNAYDLSKTLNQAFSQIPLEQMNVFSMEGNAIIKNAIEEKNKE